MKLTSSLNLISAINRQKLKHEEIIELINSLGEHCTPVQLIDFVKQQKQIYDVNSIEDEKKNTILNELEQDFLKLLHKNIDNLRKLYLYRCKQKLEGGKESNFYFAKQEIEKLKKLISNIVNVFGVDGGGSYSNPAIHPVLKITNMNFTPDYKINLDIPSEQLKITNCYFECDFIEIAPHSKAPTFRKSYDVSFNLSSIFYKDITLLQICCFFGLEDLIEKSIIFGADINYKESVSGLTALQMYKPSPGIDANKKAYIISLLDGTYENGKYQALYEKKCLQEGVPKIENKALSNHKI